MYPEIAAAFSVYLLCREQQLFTIERSKGKNRVQRIVIPWTVSFHLPEAGGMLDQPNRLMTFFGQFMAGDRKAANNRLSANS